MNTFNYQQKIAIMRILLDIIHADGRIDEREVFYFNKLKETFGLSDNAHADVEKKSSLLALVQIKFFDAEQKNYLADLMSNMIVVDDDIDSNEIAVYDVVASCCGLTDFFDHRKV